VFALFAPTDLCLLAEPDAVIVEDPTPSMR